MADHPNLATALAAVQAELPRLGKANTANAGTYSYRYADLADVSQAILPLLGKHGLSFSSKPTLDEQNRFVLAYTLRHTSGDVDSGAYPLPTGRPQDVGSAITYARRYCLSAVTGIAPDADDDGATAPDVPDMRAHSEAEEQLLFDAFAEELRGAKSYAEIEQVGANVKAAKAKGELSKARHDRLGRMAGQRAAELNGAPA